VCRSDVSVLCPRLVADTDNANGLRAAFARGITEILRLSGTMGRGSVRTEARMKPRPDTELT
jgi:hypothetical protein